MRFYALQIKCFINRQTISADYGTHMLLDFSSIKLIKLMSAEN